MTLLNGHDFGAGTEESLQRVRNLPGYTTPIFNGKDEQRAKVKVDVTAKVLQLVSFEVNPHCTSHYINIMSGIRSSGVSRERGRLVLLSTRYR
jgi:hypothetical protein